MDLVLARVTVELISLASEVLQRTMFQHLLEIRQKRRKKIKTHNGNLVRSVLLVIGDESDLVATLDMHEDYEHLKTNQLH